MSKILPNRGWLLIEIIKPERKTKAGLILTESIHEEPMNCRILAIGLQTVKAGGIIAYPPQFDNRKIEVGDIVIFKARSQHEIRETLGDDQIAFIEFDSVLGLVLPEKDKEKNGTIAK